jgi:hypothetical protein
MAHLAHIVNMPELRTQVRMEYVRASHAATIYHTPKAHQKSLRDEQQEVDLDQHLFDALLDPISCSCKALKIASMTLLSGVIAIGL